MLADLGFDPKDVLARLPSLSHAEQEELLALLEALETKSAVEAARDNFLAFILMMQPDYVLGSHLKILASLLTEIEAGTKDRIAVSIAPRHGKLCADDTPVMTPSGWTTHGQLSPGDYVFHPSGRPVRVVAVSSKAPANVKMSFGFGDNQEDIWCNENHEWVLWQEPARRWRTLEAKSFLQGRKTTTAGKRPGLVRPMYKLPLIEALQFPPADLPMPPYALGVWLGNGTLGKSAITHHIDDVGPIREMERLGYAVSSVWKQVSPVTVTTSFGGLQGKGHEGKLNRDLKATGVYHHKHIPQAYLYGSLEQRLELLAGLIDTDGACDVTGRVTFSTTSVELAEGVMELVNTFGWRPYKSITPAALSSSGVQGRNDVIQVGFSPLLDIPLRVPRKIPKRKPVRRMIGLWSVERSSEGKIGHCIQVDSPDGLYLVGRTLLPTHNSYMLSYYFPAWYLGRNPTHYIITASHTADLAVDFSRKVRNLITSSEYKQVFPEVSVAADTKAAGRWNTNHGGEVFAVGTGGAVAGRGAHLALCIKETSTVSTARGPVPAGSLQVGERVYTHKGFLPVSAIRQTVHEFEIEADGAVMSEDHPVWTFNRGWVVAGSLTTRDWVYTLSFPQLMRIGYERLKQRSARNARAVTVAGVQQLESRTGEADEYGWLRTRVVRLCSRGGEEEQRRQGLLMGLLGAAYRTRLFGLLVGVRRLRRIERRASGATFIDITVPGANTFFVEKLLVHNCDDPFSEQDALSGNLEVYEKVYQWFTYGLRTRLMPTGRMAVVHTRWHKKDLIGRLISDMALNPQADQYEVVEFPAILPSGKSLWPEMWPIEKLERTRASMPAFQWSAQYLQTPTSEEAAVIKREWWQAWTEEKPPKCEYTLLSYDTAFSKSDRANYSACTLWGIWKNRDEQSRVILLNAWRDKLEFPELKQKVLADVKEWNPDGIIVEAKATGAPLIAELRRAGIPVQEYVPSRGNDKVARVNSVADMFSSGMVYAPRTRWAEEVIEEVADFPAGEHDDWVDTVSMALMRIRNGGLVRLKSDYDIDDDPLEALMRASRRTYW